MVWITDRFSTVNVGGRAIFTYNTENGSCQECFVYSGNKFHITNPIWNILCPVNFVGDLALYELHIGISTHKKMFFQIWSRNQQERKII